jgi:hypothetical protein
MTANELMETRALLRARVRILLEAGLSHQEALQRAMADHQREVEEARR